MSLPVQPRGPWVWAVYWSWQLVPLDSYQNVLGGASMKQGQDGTVPNILFPRSPVWVGGGPAQGRDSSLSLVCRGHSWLWLSSARVFGSPAVTLL